MNRIFIGVIMRRVALGLSILGAILFLAAMFVPFVSLRVQFSENFVLDAVFRSIAGDSLKDRQYSLPGSAWELVKSGRFMTMVTGFLIAILAIGAPAMKFFLLIRIQIQKGLNREQYLAATKVFSNLGMTEVFLIGTVMTLLITVPVGRFELKFGYALFLLSALCSAIAAKICKSISSPA
ncbi:MAG: paraquat-inducible protein A [Fimbriiglobus sp.]